MNAAAELLSQTKNSFSAKVHEVGNDMLPSFARKLDGFELLAQSFGHDAADFARVIDGFGLGPGLDGNLAGLAANGGRDKKLRPNENDEHDGCEQWSLGSANPWPETINGAVMSALSAWM